MVAVLGGGTQPPVTVTVNGHSWKSRVAIMRGRAALALVNRPVASATCSASATPIARPPTSRLARRSRSNWSPTQSRASTWWPACPYGCPPRGHRSRPAGSSLPSSQHAAR
ncbi:hypothetical protein [Actinoplanes sp. NPDC026623]|uniref:hypothetical protein n=1 Tax=Actinoplanes sp. NPDC026623 TaxID=3155610 RepID=UPI00340C50A8